MTREDHMKWCKQRANEYLAQGDIANGVTSMLSDLQKHPETALPAGSPLGMLGMMAIQSGNISEARRFVDGFN